jgi:hypothetical protein
MANFAVKTPPERGLRSDLRYCTVLFSIGLNFMFALHRTNTQNLLFLHYVVHKKYESRTR